MALLAESCALRPTIGSGHARILELWRLRIIALDGIIIIFSMRGDCEDVLKLRCIISVYHLFF